MTLTKDWEYLAKHYDNFTTTLIPDKTVLRLGIHISSMRYLEDEAFCFTEVTKYDNIGFDHKVVQVEDGKEDGKETITDSEEEASKKKVWSKAMRDMSRALLLVAIPGLFASISASVSMPGLFITVLGWSSAISGLSATIPRLSIAMLELFAAMPGLSVTVFRLFTPASASVIVPGSSTPIFLSVSAPILPKLSPLPFPILFLPKIPMPNLAAKRQRLDNTISGWSGRSKKVLSKEFWNRRIKKAASEEAFLPKAPLFFLFFRPMILAKEYLIRPSSTLGH